MGLQRALDPERRRGARPARRGLRGRDSRWGTGHARVRPALPATSTDGPQALLLAGGSAFGLVAAEGVVGWLAERSVGFATPAATVPLVSAAVAYEI
jgi:hypothetical protein